jgi:signal transduction histidine kinase
VPVVLHSVIDQALAFCEHVVTEHHGAVERAYGEDVLTVRGTPEQLVQVFVNLVTNACHALPPSGGRITLRTRTHDEGRRVEIEVEDNGHGIAAEHITQVFAPFFTTKAEGRGTGLGLTIVKSIVEAHGGEIRVERVDPGTRFIVSLLAGR